MTATGIQWDVDAQENSQPDGGGWPAPPAALAAGRRFLNEAAARSVVVACDRDVDGLTAGLLLTRTLERLGARDVALIPARKGEHVHTDEMRARLRALAPDHLVVADMGSRGEPIVAGVPTLVVDHHQPRGFPPGAVVVSAHGHEPIAPSSLLAYELGRALVPLEPERFLALLGTVADLGTALPFPEMTAALAEHGRTATTDAVALLNAARRSDDAAVGAALDALRAARAPRDIARGLVPGVDELRRCRAHVQTEVVRCSKTPPRLAGRFALLRFSSPAQVHPLVATRWQARLRDRIVIAANEGYLPGRVNFAMRTRLPVNLVDLLRSLPFEAEGDWGNGHAAASGGSLRHEDFERLLTVFGFARAGEAATL